MTKIVSLGYMPTHEDEARAEELKSFHRNFYVILENFDKILENEKYFFCELPDGFLSMPYVGSDGPIKLGILVMLWQQGQLIRKCDDCDGEVYIRGAGGSPLSGSYKCWGLCSGCLKDKCFSGESGFSSIWKPIRELMKKFPSFTSKAGFMGGLSGETTPDVNVSEKNQAADIATLISDLKLTTYN